MTLEALKGKILQDLTVITPHGICRRVLRKRVEACKTVEAVEFLSLRGVIHRTFHEQALACMEARLDDYYEANDE